MILEKELFPTVVRVDIPFSYDRREMFSEQIHAAAETVLNNSLRPMGKGMSTITPVGKSSLFKNTKAWRHSDSVPGMRHGQSHPMPWYEVVSKLGKFVSGEAHAIKIVCNDKYQVNYFCSCLAQSEHRSFNPVLPKAKLLSDLKSKTNINFRP